MGQLRWDSRGRTAMTVKLGHDIWDMTLVIMLDRTAQTGQSGQVGLTGQPGQVRAGQDREDGMLRHDSKDQIVGTGELGIKAMEQDSWERTGETGQADKTGVTEQIGQGR